MSPNSRAVVLRALKLGDVLTAIPALRALAGLRGHEIVLCAPHALAPIIDASGAVDDLVDMPGLGPLPSGLEGAEFAINLHGRGPHSTRHLLATRPEQLVAFAHDEVPETAGFPRWDDDEHEVQRWCRLLAESDVPPHVRELARVFGTSSGALRIPKPPLRHRERVGLTVLHPGASAGARRWPADRWAELRRGLSSRHHRIVVTGDASEVELKEAVLGRPLDDRDRTATGEALDDLMEIVAHARLVVVGDTGVAHLATAYRTPSVVLFGPESPARWGPPADGPHVALWHGPVSDPRADELAPALARITVADVLAAIDSLAGA